MRQISVLIVLVILAWLPGPPRAIAQRITDPSLPQIPAKGILPGGRSSLANWLTFSPDGKYIALASSDIRPFVRIWDVKSEKMVRDLIGFKERPFQCDFSPDGKWLAACAPDKTMLWRTDTWEPQEIEDKKSITSTIKFSKDSERFLTGDGRKAYLWNVKSRKLEVEVDLKLENLAYPVLSPDNRHLGVWSVKGDLALIDLKSKEFIAKAENQGEGMWQFEFSPCGKYLASMQSQQFVKVWKADLNSFVKLEAIPKRAFLNIHRVAFQPNSERAALATSSSNIFFYDIHKGIKVMALTGVHGVVTLAFSPDGNTLAAATNEGYVHLWNLPAVEKK